MKILRCVGLAIPLLVMFAWHCLAQTTTITATITTYAGPPVAAIGAQATTQAIDSPLAAIPDGSGGFYLSSGTYHRVYRVMADGTLRLIAGNGNAGFSGDRGPAVAAELSGPSGLALDQTGSLFIADTRNNRVRKITPDGVITTVAGLGTPGFSGDEGAAILAQLNSPVSVAVDQIGNLFISDVLNNRIRKVTTDGVIRTIAGIGPTQTPGGFGGDGGPGISAQLNAPQGIAVDTAGNLFIADQRNNRIRKLTPDGVINTVAGIGPTTVRGGFAGDGGPALSAQLHYPADVALDGAGNIFIADRDNNRVRKISPNGLIVTVAGNSSSGTFDGDGGPATLASLYFPAGVAVDSAGNLLITDTGNHRIRRVTSTGNISTIAGAGTSGFGGDGGPALGALLTNPVNSVMDSSGNLFIADSGNNRVRKVTADGLITNVRGFGRPTGLEVDANDNLLVVETLNNRILKVTPAGGLTTVAGTGRYGYSGDGGLAEFASFATPLSIAVDRSGNLFVADADNNRVRKITPGGTISTVAGTGPTGLGGFSGDNGPAVNAQLSYPAGVAVDTAGNLYIADLRNHRIRKVSTAGIISTVAGSGTAGFSGDGGPFRLYAEASGSIQTGIAVANLSTSDATVTLELTRLDGSSTGLTGSLRIPASGQTAAFLNQVQGLASLQTPFQGILRVSSSSAISVVGLRGRYNERNDFLITTTPPANETTAPSGSALFFPHVADSGGYTTQFILFGAQPGSPLSGTMQFFSQAGGALNVVLQ